ncbi:hypothetical protein quinque_002381 [Culex quinquefasciatus]
MTRRKGRPGEDPQRSPNDATLPAYLDPDGSHGKVIVLMMKAAEEGKVLPSNPFTLAKSIQSTVGTVTAAYRDKEKNFVLKVRGEEKVKKLKRLTELIDVTKVVVSEHPRLNQCKVVVTCNTVDDLSDEELKAEETLQAQGVIDVKRFRKNGKPIPTMVLTIRGTVAPDAVYFGFDRCRTKPYAQAPLQCYRCFEYGHPKARCSAPEEVCRNCSTPHPIQKDELGRTICQKPARCLHCNGPHSPTSRTCEFYKQEEEIEKIRGEGKSPREARRIVEERRTQEENNYAAIVKKTAVQARLDQPAIEVLRKELANAQKALKEAQQEIARLKKDTSINDPNDGKTKEQTKPNKPTAESTQPDVDSNENDMETDGAGDDAADGVKNDRSRSRSDSVSSSSSQDALTPNDDNQNPNLTNQQTVSSTSCPALTDGAADDTITTTPTTTAIAVQWNLRGMAARTNELQQLLEQHRPVVVALQEIKTKKKKDKNKLDRRRYDWQFCFKPSDGYSNGVALGIDKDVPHRYIDVQGPLQVVAARVEWPVLATFVSIYICREDGKAEIEDKLAQLVPQLPSPVVLLGDFNAHSPLWGGNHIDQRGKAIESILGKHNFIILNDGSHTRVDPRDGRSSAIDLSIVSDTIAPELVWSVDVDTRESDHYPLFIHSVDHTRAKRSRRPRWKYDSADWTKFAKEVQKPDPESVQEIEEAILAAAEVSIPRTSTKVGRKAVHWWTKEVEEAVKDRRKKLRRLRKLGDDHPNKVQALDEFKLARNTVRQIVEKAKADSWAAFVSGIAPSSGTTEIWRLVNVFRNGPKASIHQLVINGKLSDEPEEVAETLADYFAEVSAARQSTHRRTVPDQPTPTFEGGETSIYNETFSIEELDWAIRKGERVTCDTCGVPLTVEHILCTCRKFDGLRDDGAQSVYGALCNDPEAEKALLRYLRNTKLLTEI